MNEREILALLRALSRIGGPLANAVNPALGQGVGGVGALLGLISNATGGNVPGAIGSAAGVGSQIARLLDFPGVSRALGAVGGPVGLIQSIMNGNIGGAITSLPATAAAATQGLSAAGALSPAVAGTVGTVAGALAPYMLMMTPAFVDTGGMDMFDSLFGGAKSQAEKQHDEYANYVEQFPRLVQDRVKGASLLDSLQSMTPEQIQDALKEANTGVRATDLSPAYSHLAQPDHPGKSPMAANIPGMDMSWWEKIAPALEGANWLAFTGLKDKATNAGIDITPIVGDQNRQMSSGQGHVFADASGNNVDADPNGNYSQSAYDLSNTIAGVGGNLGINWGARGNERAGENQGYTVYDDQLSGYGFQPGNQAAAVLKYLSKLDPSVTQHENWQMYRDKLGVTDDMLNAIPDYTIEARNKPMNPLVASAFQVPDGGGA